jgi:type VI secretion system secreted protein Hcp
MALEMFLKVDGVEGGTRNYQHKGWADMLSWNWNLQRQAAAGEQACTGMNQITILKAIGRESAALLRLFVEQTPIKAVEISVMPVVGKRELLQKYLSIVMRDVRINAMRTDGEAEESFFRERLVLEFEKIKYEIFHHTASVPNSGSASADSENFVFAWDLSANLPFEP